MRFKETFHWVLALSTPLSPVSFPGTLSVATNFLSWHGTNTFFIRKISINKVTGITFMLSCFCLIFWERLFKFTVWSATNVEAPLKIVCYLCIEVLLTARKLSPVLAQPLMIVENQYLDVCRSLFARSNQRDARMGEIRIAEIVQ